MSWTEAAGASVSRLCYLQLVILLDAAAKLVSSDDDNATPSNFFGLGNCLCNNMDAAYFTTSHNLFLSKMKKDD